MISNYSKVPKLPINGKGPHGINKTKLSKKDKSIDITTSFDLSNINKKESEQNTIVKKQFNESTNKNDESVYAPAFIIGEKDPEWDSFLDDTKIEVKLFIEILIIYIVKSR